MRGGIWKEDEEKESLLHRDAALKLITLLYNVTGDINNSYNKGANSNNIQ